MADDKHANPELNLEVDLMIIDYLVCSSINRIIQGRIAERRGTTGCSCETYLQMVDSFLPMFKARHGEAICTGLSMKLRVLTFCNLFIRRYKRSQFKPCLQTLRTQRRENTARAEAWLRAHGGGLTLHRDQNFALNIPESSLLANRRQMLHHMGYSLDAEEGVSDLESTVSLLDVLPEFMSICYTPAFGTKKPQLMELGANFMLHAALEQVLIYGRKFQDAVDECFAWSWSDDAGRNIDAATEMESDAVTWTTLRDLLEDKILTAMKETDAVNSLRSLLQEHPLFTFEGDILEMLDDLMPSLGIPILTQLESGRIHGATVMETDALKQRVGIL